MISSRLALVTAVCALGLSGVTCDASTPPPGSNGATLIDAIAHIRSTREFSGSVLVGRGDTVLTSATFGYADRERRVRTQLNTRYRISGLTSAFTWIGLLQLQDAHRLDLNRSVCAYIPRCPNAWRPLRPRDLMAGQSGLRRFPPGTFAHQPPTLAEYIDRLRGERLFFKPGTKFAPNTSPYYGGSSPDFMAARLLEFVSHENWTTYVRRHILRPAGMTATGFRQNARDAIGYGRDKSQRIVRRPLPMPTVNPPVDLGLWSTVLDALRLDRALRSGTLLSKESLAVLDTPALPQHLRRGYGYSCCWDVSTKWGSHLAETTGGHGYGDGFYAVWERYPADGVAVFVFTNLGGAGPSYQVADLAASIALGEYPQVVSVDATSLAGLAGSYEYVERRGGRTFRARVTIIARAGHLIVASAPGFTDLEGPLLPSSENTFFAVYNPAYQLAFKRDGSGTATGFTLRNPNWGSQILFRRIAQ
jgi:CubicO group peptidase (beta-lactamase class C family)